MIYLTCGTPGSGKTLWTINFVEALRKESGRQVFYHGINELTLDWTLFDDPTTWPDLPDGSIIVIDECQGTFPNRSQRGVPPEFISKLETHRHFGLDIFLITQNPQLMDNHVRKLVGEYRFLDRPANMAYAVVWKFRHVCDWKNTTERQGAEKERWKYPKESYGWYKSAEVHTHKAKLPKFLIWVPVLLSILGFCGYTFYNTLFAKERTAKNEPANTVATGKSTSSTGSGHFEGIKKTDQKTKEILSKVEYLAMMVPRHPELPYSAPYYDEIAKPLTFPKVAACIESKKGCECWTQQATKLKIDPKFCHYFVENGYFDQFMLPEALPAPSERSERTQTRVARATVASEPTPASVVKAGTL